MEKREGIRFRDPSYDEMIRDVRNVIEGGLSEEQKEDEYKCYLAEFEHSGNFPNYFTSSGFNDLIINRLGSDGRFCIRAGIDYANFDKYNMDIKLALGRFYDLQLREEAESKS